MAISSVQNLPPTGGGRYRHLAFLYEDDAEYISVLSNFIQTGVDAGEQVLVVVPDPKIDPLSSALSDPYYQVRFMDMLHVGRNPARVIAMWSDFLDNADGQPCRGVGEPVHRERERDARTECGVNEQLVNIALGDPEFLLACPYDTRILDHTTLDAAVDTHPWLLGDGGTRRNDMFYGGPSTDALFGAPLDPIGTPAVDFPFGPDDLARLRWLVASAARDFGLSTDRTAGFVLAADEVAGNVLLHGGGGGTARWWVAGDELVCEVTGPGTFTDPLVGRFRLPVDRPGGRGLWLANQLCDLVQLRNVGDRTVVRLHVGHTPSS